MNNRTALAMAGFMVLSHVSLLAQAAPTPPAAPDPGLRLIQTSVGHREWMSPEQVMELALRSHEAGHCGGFMDVTEHPDKEPVYLKPFGLFEGREPRHSGEVNRLLPELTASGLLGRVDKLASFHNRFNKSETGVAAAHWIRDEFKRMAQGRADVSVELFSHKFVQPSVIARIAGHGPHADEMVIVGAHEDSVNWSGGSWNATRARAPGADDDASGVATVLETFRVLIESGHRPDRTLVFMTYAGEEVGLLGSQDIAEKFKRDHARVVGVLQLDMTMYPGSSPRIHMISDHVDPALTRFTESLIDAYVKVPWIESDCGYACSDHASWTDAGFPSAFPFEADIDGSNPKIHTDQDAQALISTTFGLHFARLATAFMVELGND